MIVHLDPSSPGSPGEQLLAQIAAAIDRDELRCGERLPTIRRLAADLGLARGTVARAYSELERDGWVTADGRRGTIVAARVLDNDQDRLAAAADTLARAAVGAGIDATAARRALDLAFARLHRANSRPAAS